MGLPQVMRVIDLEIKSDGKNKIPFTVMRALNDISVLAVGVRETWKHINFVTCATDHVYMVNELETRWEKRQRPWKLVVENALQALPESEFHKLDKYVRKAISPRLRHLRFWAVIDKHMRDSSQGGEINEVLDIIQRTAPIDTTTEETDPTYTWVTCEAVPTPSNTKVRRSRYRRGPPSQHLPPAASPAEKAPLRDPIVIEPKTNREFWTALLAPSSENSTELHWDDFCKAMKGIGYRIIPQTGSSYRFEYDEPRASASNGSPGTIIFHAPHGGGKVTHRQARMWWLGRLLSRFELIL